MTPETLRLINQYATKGILVDTNILLLYFIGLTRKDRISRFSRTEQFAPQDYDLLVALFADFKDVVTTPTILAEVSSFINQIGEPDRSACYANFAIEIPALSEMYIPSREVASDDWSFVAYGLTDCGVAEVAKNRRYLVLTDDRRVVSFLTSRSIDAVSFDQLRATS